MKVDEMNGCGNCTKLRWNRRKMGLTQKQFGEKVGLTQATICKLERDETAWDTMKDETVDKIMSFYSSMASWQPERPDKVLREINEVVEKPNEADEKKPVEKNETGNAARLKSTRIKLGMSQTEFAVEVGLCERTVRILENDDTAWATLRDSTVDKIMAFYSNMASCKSKKTDKVPRENDKVVNKPQITEETIMKPEPVIEKKPVETGLSKQDEKTLALIEFAYEELTQAETHDDFALAVKMIKKIIDRY